MEWWLCYNITCNLYFEVLVFISLAFLGGGQGGEGDIKVTPYPNLRKVSKQISPTNTPNPQPQEHPVLLPPLLACADHRQVS